MPWPGEVGSDGGGEEAVLRRVVVIGDGAKWIWEHVASAFSSEHEGPDALLRLLATCRAPREEAAKTLETQRGYFRTNAERMRYPIHRDQGLPIGSGAVEPAAKHLVQHRMKRPGMRWSELGARAILHVPCALLNHDLLRA